MLHQEVASPPPTPTYFLAQQIFSIRFTYKKMNEHGTMLRIDSEIEGIGLLQTSPHIFELLGFWEVALAFFCLTLSSSLPTLKNNASCLFTL